MLTRISHFIPTIAFACACSYTPPSEGGGETGELVDGPPEIADPPQWVCKERAPDITLPDDDESIPEQETCTLTPTIPHHGWPGKPYWKGISAFFDTVPREIGDFPYLADDSIADPIYSWLLFDDPAIYFELHHRSPDHPTLPKTLDDFRSGLIGNFALWIGGVPDNHPRPPIVTASLLGVFNNLTTIVGHPFYSGRYNAYGMPCSSTPPHNSSFQPASWGFLGVGQFDLQEPYDESSRAECIGYVRLLGAAPASPLYPLALGFVQDDQQAALASVCLSNNGVYQLPAALTTAEFRNGLVWVNWGADYAEEFKAWVIANVPQIEPLLVALDALEFTGWDIWPLNPDYPYNQWSYTGVCAYKSSIAIYDGEESTMIGCPIGYRAILPDFDLPLTHEVNGYCTIPHITPPPDGLADTTPLDEVLVGQEGQGFTGARYISLADISDDELRVWAESLATEPTEDGYKIEPVNDLGRGILDAFGMPAGSTILAVNNLLAARDSAGEQATLLDFLAEFDRAVRERDLVMIVADTPDGRRLHRYLVLY